MLNFLRNYFRLLAEGRENGMMSHAFHPVLTVAGQVYGAAVGMVRSLYEKKVLPRKRLPFPVISVGNLTWGGTGKTPFVEYLARKIGEQHRTPLLLTRGYSHDEVEQFRHHLPRAVIGVGRDRAAVAEKLTKERRVDVAILDDGLQHWPIERDIEVITLNALNPFGNGQLIPRGILREPVSTLKKAAIIAIAHVNLVKPEELTKLREKIRQVAPSAFLVETYLEPLFFYRAKKRSRLSIDRLKNQRVATFSGVGAPRSFQLLLSRLHLKPVRNFEFADHHMFSETDLKEIKQVSQSGEVDEVITTEKDFYRSRDAIANILDPLVLAVRLRISAGEDVLTERLFRLLGVTRS